jgi:hypothetical protein
MLELYNSSIPKKIEKGQWHIPFGDKMNESRLIALNNNYVDIDSPDWHKSIDELKRKIAVARCARISYHNFEGKDDYEADIKLCDRLFGSIPRHLSPAEHSACCIDDGKYYGNFKSWKQYRKFFSDENLSDPRVKKHE